LDSRFLSDIVYTIIYINDRSLKVLLLIKEK